MHSLMSASTTNCCVVFILNYNAVYLDLKCISLAWGQYLNLFELGGIFFFYRKYYSDFVYYKILYPIKNKVALNQASL